MAFRRSICTRATLFARRFNPTFSYMPHDHDSKNKKNEEPGCHKIDEFYDQKRSFGTYLSNYSGPTNLFPQRRSSLGGIGGGVGFHRYMSTSVGGGAEKVEFLSDVTGVMSDTTVDVVGSQVPVLSEVAVAAADSYLPVAALQYLIDGVHSFTGLNWAGSIVVTTLLIRCVTLPLLINQLKSTSKLSIMRPRLEEIKEEMQANGHDVNAMNEGKQKMNALFREYGVTPFTPLKGIFIQGPIFISFFLGIRNMADKVPSFKTGGAYWFTDLTTPDSMYIFPVLTALTFLITVEFNMQEGLEGNPVAGTMKNFSRVLAVFTVPFTMIFPKAIFFYWITANIFSLAYGSVLKIPGVKEALGVPIVPVTPPTTQQSAKPISFLDAFKRLEQLKQAAADTSGAKPSAEQPKPTTNGRSISSSPSGVSQRLKTLERQVKQRKKNKKR